MSRRLTILSGVLVMVWLSPIPPPAVHAQAEPPAAQRPERRPMPDYDGRPPSSGTDPVDALLWIPRGLFAPLYFVSDYVVRRPLGWMMTELERAGVLLRIRDVFTFGPDRRGGILPTAFFEFGFEPSVGVYAFWDGFLVDENRISLQAATWGLDWLTVTITDHLRPAPDLFVTTRFQGVRRPDQVFNDIGWDATRTPRSRFEITSTDASLRFGYRPWRRSQIDYVVGHRSGAFGGSTFYGDPSVTERDVLPPAFDTGYHAIRFGASFALDSRENGQLASGGVRARAFAEQHVAFGNLPASPWIRWGGVLTLATDVLGNGRVLAVRAQTSFITPIGDTGVVPFTELLDAGGEGPLTGFWWGALRGFSVAALTLEYLWPLWVYVDGMIQLTVGNAFGEHLSDFAADRLRMSFAFGIAPRVEGEHSFELIVGFGTESFVFGADVISARLAIGARSDL
jgi:hypothetical protein